MMEIFMPMPEPFESESSAHDIPSHLFQSELGVESSGHNVAGTRGECGGLERGRFEETLVRSVLVRGERDPFISMETGEKERGRGE